MALIKMDKIRLYSHKNVGSDVLRVVQKMGVVEFTEVDVNDTFVLGEKTTFEFNYVSSRLDFAVEFLSKFEEVTGRTNKIKRAIEGPRVFVDEEEILKTAQSFYFNEIVDKAQDIEEKINDAENKIKSLKKEEESLLAWLDLDIPLASIKETKTTRTIFLQGEKENISDFLSGLKEKDILCSIDYYGEENAVFVFLKKDEKSILENLKDYSLDILELPKRRGTPKEEIERIKRAEIKAEEEKLNQENKARELTEHLPKLKMVADRILWKKEKHDLVSKAPQKSDVIVFEGWCPEDKISEIEKNITKETNLFAIEKAEIKEGEIAPVEIENTSIVRPFEAITRLYGLPGSKDLDPTPFFAGFFFIFFGLSLTDVGYGLFLFVITAALLTFFRLAKEVKLLLRLLMLGGISSFFIGILFGGYLGADVNNLPVFLQNMQIFDPIASPLPIFYMALIFGVVQIMFGLILGIVKTAKNESLKEGILNDGPWLSLFIALILWGGSVAGVIPVASGVMVWTIYAALAFLVLTQGRKEKGIIKKLLMGVLSLYESINFFSDVLSYSRLLALGLATSALAFAVNLIASMVNDMVPVVGGILMVIILVVGHLFNLAVNLLGAFIHSARLQFVEFFGKFITGTGRNFKPFKREERYVVVKSNIK